MELNIFSRNVMVKVVPVTDIARCHEGMWVLQAQLHAFLTAVVTQRLRYIRGRRRERRRASLGALASGLRRRCTATSSAPVYCGSHALPEDCIWCMCVRASYMKMTRRTNLMQQLWFIIISSLYMFRTSICPSSGVLYTGCFTTLGHNCRRWFPRSLWWKKLI